MNSGCLICEQPVTQHQMIVGLPVIRVTTTAKSQLAGSEIIFHLSCFMSHFKKPTILKAV